MKISYTDVFKCLQKVDHIDLYITQLSLNPYDPFMKAWKKVAPTKVRVSKSSMFEYKEGQHISTYQLKDFLTVKPFLKNGNFSTKKINITPNKAGDPCLFFSDHLSATLFWNRKIKEFDTLMEAKIKEFTAYKVAFKKDIVKLK